MNNTNVHAKKTFVSRTLPWSFLFLMSMLCFLAAEERKGLVGQLYKMNRVPVFQEKLSGKPQIVRVTESLQLQNLGGWRHNQFVYIRWQGRIQVDRAGSYTFHVRSDDGARIRIDGETVVKTQELHKISSASGTIQLTAGSHPIEVDYFQGTGSTGLKVSWTPPGASKQPIPSSALFHDSSAGKMETKRLERKRPFTPAREMQFGPYLSVTTDVVPNNWAYKAKIADLKKTPSNTRLVPGGMAFDSDLLRFAGGWTGGLLDWKGLEFKIGTPDQPRPVNPPDFVTPQKPGWSRSGNFSDPRELPHGPLPKSWGEYKGLYLHKKNVVFSYRAGNCEILDAPSLESRQSNDMTVYARTLHLGPTRDSLKHLIAEGNAPGQAKQINPSVIAAVPYRHQSVFAALKGSQENLSLTVEKNRILLNVEPSEKTRSVKILIWRGPLKHRSKFESFVQSTAKPVDLKKWIGGGPERWSKTSTETVRRGSDEKSFTLDTIPIPRRNPYDSWMRTAAFDFFPDGNRAAVSTWNGDVWIVSGIGNNMKKVTWDRVATGLHQPLGLKIVDGTIYTAGRDQITRLHDLNGDGEYDFYESFNDDLQATKNFHEFVFGLQTDSKGNFYFTRGGPVAPGGRGFKKVVPHHGNVMRLSPDGNRLEIFASGFRAPLGLGVGPDDRVTVGVQEGTYVPNSGIYSFRRKGGYASVPPTANVKPPSDGYSDPLCWIPHEVDNSSAGQTWVTTDQWGPFQGKMLHFSYGKSRMFLVMKDPDQHQAAVVRFPLRFRSGVLRGRFHPKTGQLYTVGLRGWQTNARRTGGFQRVRFTGKPVNMPESVDVLKNGLSVQFTRPLNRNTAEDVRNYIMKIWNVRWSKSYGSDQYRVTNPYKKGKDTLQVTDARLLDDHRTVQLTIPDLQECTNYHLQFRLKTRDDQRITPNNIYGTINKLPEQ